MSETNKTYRIRTEVSPDSNINLNVKLEQDINLLEMLSLKIDVSSNSVYRTHTSNYGCIAGRVLANNGVGVPNAKISVFIPLTREDGQDNVISSVYAYRSVTNKNVDNLRYNILPNEKMSPCHVAVGGFPNKRLTLDDATYFEVYDKYYCFSTRTNNSGDYMLFGVPTGTTTVHTDVDLSDIGYLSQTPRDMIYKGYNVNQFENSSQFKSSSNLDSLVQIKTQNNSVDVIPFWGDENLNTIGITRHDVNIDYTFEPTCIFMGSLVSESKDNGINEKCYGRKDTGELRTLVAGRGTIEMIRKRSDDSVEEVNVKGTELVDGDGVWCYQIPMNLDYMVTDEYGNLVPSNNPYKGIPTRARVRFRFSLTDKEADTSTYHLAKMLVPNNPNKPEDVENGKNYIFGTETSLDDFRDLFWNNVYTVKSYIPRIQKRNNTREKRFLGFKTVNMNEGRNEIPYNNLRIQLSFKFVLQCAIFKGLLWLTTIWNKFICACPSHVLGKRIHDGTCNRIGDGACPDLDGWYFAPGCSKGKRLKKTLDKLLSDEDNESIDKKNKGDEPICVTDKIDHLMQCIELNLAQENEVINFDFYNDWLNGTLYIPRWYVRFKKKKTFFFGLFRKKARVNACTETGFKGKRRLVQQCALTYGKTEQENGHEYFNKVVSPIGCKSNSKLKCHQGDGRKYKTIFDNEHNKGGLIREQRTYANQSVYYIKPAEWFKRKSGDVKINLYATDLVLLGSIVENNIYGMPMVSEELQATSFNIPESLSETNLNEVGYMYGLGGKYICNNTTTRERLNIVDPNNYETWAKQKEYYDDAPVDEAEYPITVAAGIDWGYTGPKLDTVSKEARGKLFKPGGHFMGLSCFRAESNIKSCVNLSRICEIGSEISRRQGVVVPVKDMYGQSGYTLDYIMPTGFISKNEIQEGDFRAIFSTLNHNGLKTKLDANRRPIYDLISLNPKNFAGELEQYINDFNNKDAFNHYGINENSISTATPVIAYTQTPEAFNADYYCFRLGYNPNDENDDLRNHYLLEDDNKVSMPMYRNSFYFYFGLNKGATAYDKFMSDYFSTCPEDKRHQANIEVSVEHATLCNKSDGKILVKTNNFLLPYQVSVYDLARNNFEDPVPLAFSGSSLDTVMLVGTGNTLFLESDAEVLTITNLSGVTDDGSIHQYKVVISSDEVGEIENVVNVGIKVPESVAGITVTGYDFSSGYCEYRANILFNRSIDSITGETGSGGYFKIDYTPTGQSAGEELVGYAINNDEAYIVVSKGSMSSSDLDIAIRSESITRGRQSYTTERADVSTQCIPVWRGDDTYGVYAVYKCGNNYGCVDVGSITIAMPANVDFYIRRDDDPETDFTFNRYIKPLLEKTSIGIWEQGQDLRYETVTDKNWYLFLIKYCHNIYYNIMGDIVVLIYETYRTDEEMENAGYYRFIDNEAIRTLKNAIYYNKSVYDLNYVHSIDVGVINSNKPYHTEISGYGEMVDEDDSLRVEYFNSYEEATESGYSLDLSEIQLPTILDGRIKGAYMLNNDKGIINIKLSSGETRDQHYKVKVVGENGSEELIPGFPAAGLTIPVIYAPFMFTVVVDTDMKFNPTSEFIEIDVSETQTISVPVCTPETKEAILYYRIYNGITNEENKIQAIEIGTAEKTYSFRYDQEGKYCLKGWEAEDSSEEIVWFPCSAGTEDDIFIDASGLNLARVKESSAVTGGDRYTDDWHTIDRDGNRLSTGTTIHKDCYPVIAQRSEVSVATNAESSSEQGGFVCVGIKLNPEKFNFETDYGQTIFTFRVIDFGENVIEERINERFYSEKNLRCSDNLAQYDTTRYPGYGMFLEQGRWSYYTESAHTSSSSDTWQWKYRGGYLNSGLTVTYYDSSLNYLSYFLRRYRGAWKGMSTDYDLTGYGKTQWNFPNDPIDKAGNGGTVTGSTPSVFTQFYDTFNDYKNEDENDSTVDIINKEWIFDENRVSFIKNYNSKSNWQIAFGMRQYYFAKSQEIPEED